MDRWRRYEWDKLHALGSSRLVQLTVILPVIGYLILFSESLRMHLALYVDAGTEPVLWRLYVLYFGFCCLSVGALIFAWQCPDEVKAHGAGFVFVERELLVHRSGDRAGQIQRTLIGIRLGLVNPAGTLHPLSPEQLVSLRETDLQGTNLEKEIGGRNLEHLMMEYFVALKASKRPWRVAARTFYDAGFLLLAFPTAAVFISVVTSFAKLIREAIG